MRPYADESNIANKDSLILKKKRKKKKQQQEQRQQTDAGLVPFVSCYTFFFVKYYTRLNFVFQATAVTNRAVSS